ncbi:putative morc, S5 domain 2 protein [Helianthus anomalus]
MILYCHDFQVPLDYSVISYLEVIFLDPRMKIKVQGSLVKSRPLAKFLHKTSIENGFVSEKPVQLILGHSQLGLEQGNCGIFLYWHGRLIEAYKRVGSMILNGENSHGLVGVIDVTDVMVCFLNKLFVKTGAPFVFETLAGMVYYA